MSQGFLERVGDYQVLRLTAPGWRLLKREGEPRRFRAAPPAGRLTSKATATWNGVDRELFDQLRGLRASSAAERNVSPDVVFGDAVLG